MKFLTIFHKQPKKRPCDYQFSNLMKRASKLKSQLNIEGLQDLQKVILRPIQSRHISSAYLENDHEALKSLEWPSDLGIFPISHSDECFATLRQKGITPLNLASDMIIPTCWHSSSITNVIGRIGKVCANEFKQSQNHDVVYTYPIGIGWVRGGNHSIAQGIIRGEGLIHNYSHLDLSSLIKRIQYNGFAWYEIESGKYLGEPRYSEIGWAWEIGRLIMELKEVKHLAK